MVIERHVGFSCNTPAHRHGSPSGNDIPPVFFKYFLTRKKHVKTPGAYDTRHNAVLHQFFYTFIGSVKILGIYCRQIFFPGKTRFVFSSRIEHGHIGIQSRNYLNNIKAFFFSVVKKSAKIIGKRKSFCKSHQPGIAEPVERSAVAMRKIHVLPFSADRTVQIVRIIGFFFLYYQLTGYAV
ncbi:MAG: hypothetical protein BWX78_01570 [Firmicutes bacterium ADurb.Bin099]|nr:MAG: hypothetical protein BWX78_01570 [Firmicutes bacterium ADurb.Bin099]